MSLRFRLIVAFFLLSVVPLGAVTYFTYRSNASAMRDAAGREAEVLAGELTERMTLVTAQISQHFEQLIDIPATQQAASEPPRPAPPARAARGNQQAARAAAGAAQATRVAERLGEVAMLLNNIEVRGFGRGRGGPGRGGPGDVPSGGTPPAPSADTPTSPAFENNRGRRGRGLAADVAPPPSPDGGPPAAPAGDPAVDGGEPGAGRTDERRLDDEGRRGGRGGFDGGAGRRRDAVTGRELGTGGPEPRTGDVAGDDHLQIDLGPMRREILQQIFPDRERWDQLSAQERDLILAKVNERMLGIQQGIRIVQQRANEQAADAMTAVTRATGTEPAPPAADSTTAPEGVPALPPPPAAPVTPGPSAVRPPLARADDTLVAAPAAAVSPLQRRTAFSGSRMDVRMMRNGQVVGQVNAEVDLPNLLATVFTTTRREKGEVPFAVDRNGRIYTPTEADRAVITALDTTASSPATGPGTVLLPDWVVVTTADPTGSELKFGIARPLGDALDDLRRSSARDAGLGLGLIGLALIGIVPLSVRLTRNLQRLSEGVGRISRGDYRARVDVTSKDEIGRLATAFNHMAADVERHQQAAVEQERLRRELELGRQIQHDMLPQGPLQLGLTEIRGISVPATEVGGDFFNYFQTASGRIALVVGDVSGKGVGAALLMANIQASLRTRLSMGQDLPALARELDADIGASTPGAVYATLFVGLLDPERRVLDYVNAGHNPQFVLRVDGGSERMDSTGLPIGLLVGHGYQERSVALAQGDTLFFYTDGCVEAENGSGEMFGSARLETLLARRPAGSADDLLLRIEQEIVRFRSGREPFDDATLMVVSVG